MSARMPYCVYIMCGITGYIGQKEATEIILEGLHAQAKGTFKTLSDMFDVNFIIPERAQYATVIGAALCTL